MTRRLGYVLAPFFFAAILAACNDGTGKNSAIKSIDIIDNNGKKIGTARISENLMGGVNLVVDASPIPEGEHGIHFHQKADCKTPSFKSAGGHINPQGKAHGLKNPGGPGNGDMPNAIANDQNVLSYAIVNERVSMTGENTLPALFDKDGSALIIHALPDDQNTQPIGGAGARIACAEIGGRRRRR